MSTTSTRARRDIAAESRTPPPLMARPIPVLRAASSRLTAGDEQNGLMQLGDDGELAAADLGDADSGGTTRQGHAGPEHRVDGKADLFGCDGHGKGAVRHPAVGEVVLP